MTKVLIASFHHESNSFNPIISDRKDFNIFFEDEIFEHIKPNDSISGIITRLKKENYELLQTVFMRAVPNGEVDKNLFIEMKNKMLEIEQAHKDEIDAITLAL